MFGGEYEITEKISTSVEKSSDEDGGDNKIKVIFYKLKNYNGWACNYMKDVKQPVLKEVKPY